MSVVKITSRNHVGLNLDAQLTFNNHINEKSGKAMKGSGPNLDFGDDIYD